MKTLIAISVLLLAGCGAEQPASPPSQLPGVVKSEFLADGAESSVVTLGGQVVYVVSRRTAVASGVSTVTLYRGSEEFTVPAPGFEFISALAHNETLYIFGTIGNRYLQMVSSADLINWSHPETVLEINGSMLYNTSVAKDADGFVLAYETDSNVPFTVHFARSFDLHSWFMVGSAFHPESYAACPTIRYIDGYYYVFFLKNIANTNYYTWTERSLDLIHWQPQTSKYALLSPESGEGTNASDMDLTELNGVTYLVYGVGDQRSWSRLKKAEYNGTQSTLVGALFTP